jgi:hypothetical protein
MNKIYTVLAFLVLLNFPLLSKSQTLAFPGAEGYGRFTTGGRGGVVYVVDKLTDTPEKPEKGSLRWAIKQKGARTIVFAVSGTIALKKALPVKEGNLTIAGQTAPGDGICIKNYPINIGADNVIVRFIRFRCGNEALESAAQDAFNGSRQKDVIIDHCSMSWSIDETASFYDNRNFTMQWCIISESLYKSGHPKGNHGYGGIWGGLGASFHHNLIACHSSRNPRFHGTRYLRESQEDVMDFRNNVIFNWGFQSMYGGEGGHHNVVNNYFKPGPATKKGEVQYRIMELTRFYFDKKVSPDTLWAGKFYITGNEMEGSTDVSANNWEKGIQNATQIEKNKAKVDVPFGVDNIVTQSAREAYLSVLEKAGVTFPLRDAVDVRIVNQAKTGICEFGGAWGEKSGIIDNQTTVGGWPDLKSKPAPKDADLDGMPDEWELKMRLDPKSGKDGALFTLSKEYTNLEVYLNSLVSM